MISSTVNGNAGNDSISVNAAGSMISSSVFGGQGNDSIALTSADSGSIYGDNGADSIDGDFTSALVSETTVSPVLIPSVWIPLPAPLSTAVAETTPSSPGNALTASSFTVARVLILSAALLL